MRHNPNNPLCDKSQYPDGADVKCTCDIDEPDDAPAPSTVIPPQLVARLAHPAQRPPMSTWDEFQAAVKELDAARKLLKPAEERWRKALDELHAEILR